MSDQSIAEIAELRNRIAALEALMVDMDELVRVLEEYIESKNWENLSYSLSRQVKK